MGKDAGDDFREGKMTLPVILAHARGSAEDRRFWKDAVEGRRASDADFAHAVALVRATRAVDDTLARARHYGAARSTRSPASRTARRRRRWWSGPVRGGARLLAC
jgi:geranylgeranyl pyrophosphate synthase